MPQVPDPAAIAIDGSEDDWGWHDPSFAVTPDQIIGWRGQHSGTTPPAGDRDGSQAGDYIALPTADETTAVVRTSWVRIKSHLNQRLQE